MKVPLTTGAYQARSLIASAQRCVNLDPEKNPEDSQFPKTYYPAPGLLTRYTSTDKNWRCLYASTDNRLFGVVGRTVVEVMADWTVRELGLITSTGNPCYMVDNGTTLILVDGSSSGYTLNLETDEIDEIDPDGFYGSDRIDYVDGYFILNRPETRQFYISRINEATFDALDFASKTGFADQLVAVMVTRRNVFVFGETTTEVWTNTGGTDFPFTRIGGAFFQFGCASKDSLAQADGSIYFLSRTEQGTSMVLRTVNYDRERISTFAMEQEFQTYERVDDAIGWTQQMGGHIWYFLTFPTANKTWVFDVSSNEWFERLYLEEDGTFSRNRGNCYAHWNGRHVTGDFNNGKLYEILFDQYTDDGNEIRRVRSFPHLAGDGKRIVYRQMQAAIQVGSALYPDPEDTGPNDVSEIRLRWSDTQGYSWSTPVSSSFGARGQYIQDVRFLRLGMARDRVFELSWTAKFPTALSGAYLQLESAAT